MKTQSIPSQAAPKPTTDERLAGIMQAMNDLQAQANNRREALVKEKMMPWFIEFMNSQPGWRVTAATPEGAQLVERATQGTQAATTAAPKVKQTFTQRMAAAMPQAAIQKVMDMVNKLKGGK